MPAAVHQLHHRPEIANIRHAFHDSDRSIGCDSDRSALRSRPSHSGSDKSYHTHPSVVYSNSSPPRSARMHHNTCDMNHAASKEEAVRYFDDRCPEDSPRASVATYASTILDEEEPPCEPPAFSVPQYHARPYEPTAIPATPSDFSELFPSHRRLAIRHDDSTLDGNMNLRVDTEVTMQNGRRCDMTLFHLRMHDLKDREFSLRRYCRDSGREVCHTSRKPQKSSSKRPGGVQRSLSSALNSMRSKSEQKSPTMASLKRNDSGYGSAHSSLDEQREHRPSSAGGMPKPQVPVDENSIKLEFSNYAQVEVKRAGAKTNKRYEFEYWGATYTWKRNVRKDTPRKEISYNLTRGTSDRAFAYIMPTPLSSAEIEREQSKGGWIGPCSMWLADDDIVRGQKDVADVIVASGLMALVDDAIRARFHAKHAQQLVIPKLGRDSYIGPKRLISEMFRRDSSSTGHGDGSTSASRRRASSSSTTAGAARFFGSVARRASDGR